MSSSKRLSLPQADEHDPVFSRARLPNIAGEFFCYMGLTSALTAVAGVPCGFLLSERFGAAVFVSSVLTGLSSTAATMGTIIVESALHKIYGDVGNQPDNLNEDERFHKGNRRILQRCTDELKTPKYAIGTALAIVFTTATSICLYEDQKSGKDAYAVNAISTRPASKLSHSLKESFSFRHNLRSNTPLVH